MEPSYTIVSTRGKGEEHNSGSSKNMSSPKNYDDDGIEYLDIYL